MNICAETKSIYIFDYEKEQITVKIESSLSEENCKKMTERIVCGKDGKETSTISFCWLFGHDLSSSSVAVIKHKVRSTLPRCIKEYHLVTICSKCDYMEDRIISLNYIDCHPAD